MMAMSIDKELMKCARCGTEGIILNLFHNRWVCMRCYDVLLQMSNEFEKEKKKLIK